MLESGTLICGKYEIIRVIGKGGMSVVYLARDYVTGQQYAIKDVERSGQDDNNKVVVQSLAAEGHMLKQLSNPHLPRISDLIEDVNSFMLVMDYVEGESLDRVIQREGPQSPENIYNWCIQICDVFHYLHNQPQPVVYRDMKPANIILQPNGNIMMIDFGTARTQKVGQYMQSDTICIGTEGFAAPEQFGGISQSDARTDIFCLGATIYNMLTGHSPCNPPKGILPLSHFDPALVDTPLDAIIKKCTRMDPNERYQTALELKADLEQARDGGFLSKKGKSGFLRKSAWQSQELKGTNGNTSGLSGLLNLGKNRNSGSLEKKEPATDFVQQRNMNGLIADNPVGAAYQGQAGTPPELVTDPCAPGQQTALEGDEDSPWRKLILIGVISAIVLLLTSLLFAALQATTGAIISLLFTAGAVVLVAIALVFERKQRSDR